MHQKSIYENASPVIVPSSESFDIDTEADFQMVKKLFNKNTK